MKTAFIFTQPLGRNYGGILQNYALQTVLSEFNFKPVNIEFRKKSIRRIVFEKFFLNVVTIGISCHLAYTLFKRFLTRTLYSKLDLFLRRRLHYICIEKDESEILDRIKRTKDPVIIVGSDQVWRPKFSPFLPFYFCSFLDKKASYKHIAYAASFGVDFWELSQEETNMARKHIAGFDAVSVREKSAVDLCKTFLDYDKATWVPDPTLLLKPDDYLKLFRHCPHPDHCIVTYFLRPTEEKETMLDAVLKEVRLKRVDLSPKIQQYPLRSPEEWLACIKHAAYIVTDSFHGTVFSLLFHKQFVVLHNEYGGDTRLKEILELFHICERLFQENDSSDILEMLKKQIDYDDIDNKLDSIRKIGYDFLKKNL